MRAVTASIVHEDPYMAGRETAAELLGALGGAPDLVLVFATSRHSPEKVSEGLWSRLPAGTRLLGCSSFAEIGADGATTGSVTAMGIQSGRVEHQLFKLDKVEGSSFLAGRALAAQIVDFQPALVIVLPDGLCVNSTKLVAGMHEILGDKCPVIGGVASEQLEFVRTSELYDREVLTGGVVALALRGPLVFATVAKAGFQPVGGTRTCTRVLNDNLILELDGAPALGIYKDFLGPEVVGRPLIGTEYPLALVTAPSTDYMASDERSQVIRVVRHLDEERGALLCGGDVPEGSKIRLTRAVRSDLIDAAVMAMDELKKQIPNPQIALFFNCGGRKLVLGARYHEELEAACAALDPNLPRVGFYTYGEIAPVGGITMYHDETFTAALIGAL